jgi:hypothetical protein
MLFRFLFLQSVRCGRCGVVQIVQHLRGW